MHTEKWAKEKRQKVRACNKDLSQRLSIFIFCKRSSNHINYALYAILRFTSWIKQLNSLIIICNLFVFFSLSVFLSSSFVLFLKYFKARCRWRCLWSNIKQWSLKREASRSDRDAIWYMRIVLIVLLAAADEWKGGHKNETILLSYVWWGKNEKRASGSSLFVVFRVKKLMWELFEFLLT